MKRISTNIIQKCQLGDTQFSKPWFNGLIEKMSPEDFDLFCREIMHLNMHYDSTVGLIVSDKVEVRAVFPDVTFELDEIDFNSPVTFRNIG